MLPDPKLLIAQFPAAAAVYEGPEHVVVAASDAYHRMVGGRNIIGKRFRDALPELVAQGFVEMLDRVRDTGSEVRGAGVPARWDTDGDGLPEDHFVDFVYSPLRDDGGAVHGILVLVTDVTDRVQAEAALQRSEIRFRSVFAAAGMGMAIVDPQGRPLEVNPALRQMLGYESDDGLVGVPFSEFTHPEDVQADLSLYSDLLAGGRETQAITAASLSDRYAAWRDYAEPTDGTGIYTMVGEARRPMRLTQEELEHHPRWRGFGEHAGSHPPMRGWLAAPLTGRDGRDLGMIQLSDRYQGEFTEQDEALLVQLAQTASIAIENARLYQEAVEANQAKSGFLAIMSHELRPPLNAMIGYADLLLMGVPDPISEAARAQVERIRWAARHLLQLIEEILTFSRLEAGRERVDVEPVQLRELAQEVSAIIEPLAGQRAVTFRTELPEEPVTLETDPRKVRQILLNLLGNAAKFTERGEIVFRAAVEGERVLLDVRDTGIGIAPEHQQRVFEPFWQAETAMHARVGGTGLGLPVTAKLVQLLEGTIELDSEPGRGSLFRVSLPRRIRAS